MKTSTIVLDKGKESFDLHKLTYVKRVVLWCPLKMVGLKLLKRPT